MSLTIFQLNTSLALKFGKQTLVFLYLSQQLSVGQQQIVAPGAAALAALVDFLHEPFVVGQLTELRLQTHIFLKHD